MTKSPHAFRSIGEVARMVGVATHVLRYWEAQFPALSPVKRSDGRRYYRPDDVMLAAGICEALREEGLTIRGTKRLIAQDRGEGLRARGRLRLGAQLGLEGDNEVDSRPAKSARARSKPTDDSKSPRSPATRKPAAKRAPAKTVEIETLPLFPELAHSADSQAGEPAHAWLTRLTVTASALRKRAAPLPKDAKQVAEALRNAMTAGAQR